MQKTDILEHRLRQQQLVSSSCKTPLEVVTWLGAMQAQDYPGGLWAVGARLPGSTQQDIEAALASGDIVRTWPMRGTLHFVPAKDAKWMIKLMGHRALAKAAARERNLGLNEAIFTQGFAAFHAALAGGKRLKRPEMLAALEAVGIDTSNQRGYHIIWHAAQEALICLGPMDGKQQTFVLFDEWVRDSTAYTNDEALIEIARRYFTSHGPVPLKEFSRWTGLTLTHAKQAVAALASELQSEYVDGVEYWMPRTLLPLPPRKQAFLLAGFDEYMLGYGDRSLQADVAHHQRIVPGNNGMFMPTIIIDGRVVGLWKRTIKRTEIVVVLEPFAPLTKPDMAAIADAADTYGHFMGLPVRIETK